jgi:CheY-like chemotaxis protein
MSRSVLIVEDDRELQEIYGVMLESLGWELVPAYDGREALELLESVNPDLVLLDILMDKMKGDEFYHLIRQDPRTADVPVIILTVLSDEGLEDLLEGDGRTRYLRKPFQRQQLLEAVEFLWDEAK